LIRKWHAVKVDVILHLVEGFCRADEEFNISVFVDRSALFGGYFDSLGIREEAKKEWDLKES